MRVAVREPEHMSSTINALLGNALVQRCCQVDQHRRNLRLAISQLKLQRLVKVRGSRHGFVVLRCCDALVALLQRSLDILHISRWVRCGHRGYD